MITNNTGSLAVLTMLHMLLGASGTTDARQTEKYGGVISRLHNAVYGAENISDHIDDDIEVLAGALCVLAKNCILTIAIATR